MGFTMGAQLISITPLMIMVLLVLVCELLVLTVRSPAGVPPICGGAWSFRLGSKRVPTRHIPFFPGEQYSFMLWAKYLPKPLSL